LGGAALTADLSSDLARYRRCRRGRDRPRHRVGQARRALHVLAWRLLPRHGRQGQGWHPQSGAHGLGTASRAGAGGQVRTRSGAVRGAQTAVASPHSPELVWGFPCQADSAWAFPARRAGSSFKTKPLVRRRAASALRRCVGAPLVPTVGGGADRRLGPEGPSVRKRTVRNENTDENPTISTGRRRFCCGAGTNWPFVACNHGVQMPLDAACATAKDSCTQ